MLRWQKAPPSREPTSAHRHSEMKARRGGASRCARRRAFCRAPRWLLHALPGGVRCLRWLAYRCYRGEPAFTRQEQAQVKVSRGRELRAAYILYRAMMCIAMLRCPEEVLLRVEGSASLCPCLLPTSAQSSG